MDVQLKKGLLEPITLSVINQKDSYGYQIIKDISNYIEITESTLYPILKRLEANKMVNVFNQEHDGRLRKYYQITKLGKKQIKTFIEEWDQVIKIYDFIEKESEGL
ncbi:MAG: PadR family transcriptional regulator [Erysipelotrichaceae bacterium]